MVCICVFLLVTFSAVSLCAENATWPSVQQNSTNSSGDHKISAPSEFPKEGLNVKTANTIQNTLNLNNDSQNKTDPHDEKVSTKTNTPIVKPNLIITYALNNTAVSSSKIDTSLYVQQNSTHSSGDSKISVPSEIPKGLNVKTANTIQNTLHLNNDSQNKTDSHDEKISTKKNTSIVKSTLNITYPVNNNNTTVNSSKIDTEVLDLLNSTVFFYLTPNRIPDSPPNITYQSQKIDRDIELIENDENTEDVLRRNSILKEKVSNPGVPLVQGQVAAILAGVFVVISVIAYVGLLSWRRYLENRYGDRQMLVTEDEFNGDLKNFSI